MKQTLTTADLEEITGHLDHCLEVFSRQEVLLTAAELHLKAMLTTVAHELKQRGKGASYPHLPTPSTDGPNDAVRFMARTWAS